MSDHTREKRHFHRILYRTPAELVDSCGHSHSCEVIDLSLRGCLLEIGEPCSLEEGSCSLKIPLSDDILIQMEVAPVHRRGTCQGFACRHIDLSSLTLLRRLIELNLGDPALLERDLSALCPPDR